MTFRTSRELDFFSEKELTAQTGHSRDEWPSVIAKELIDNALDACEEHDIPPHIIVSADACGITVADNGPGIPASTIDGVLDFSARASSNEAYRSPTRGAQGNALKTLVGIPYVLDPEHGRLVITAAGAQHSIACGLDQISQRACFDVEKTLVSEITRGGKFLQNGAAGKHVDRTKTKVSDDGPPASFYKSAVRVEWTRRTDPDSEGAVWPFDYRADIATWRRQLEALARGYSLFNPHLTLTFDWLGERVTWQATDPAWKKWKPSHPTSPFWYQLADFKRLVGAYITHGRQAGTDRTVADFVAEFDGLTGSRKRTLVIELAGMKRTRLSELAGERDLREDLLDRLLTAMKAHTKPVHPRRLGQIGREHFTKRLTEFGCDPKSIDYRAKKRIDDGVPFVMEMVFGYLGGERRRQIYAGANWSPGIKNPFRTFGKTGEGLESLLSTQYASGCEPVVFAAHLAHPRVEYSDRGKSAIVVRE